VFVEVVGLFAIVVVDLDVLGLLTVDVDVLGLLAVDVDALAAPAPAAPPMLNFGTFSYGLEKR
jgi:hypothetical protein